MFSVVFFALLGVSMSLPWDSNPRVTFDCRQRDEVVWWGCGSYGQCRGGQYTQIDCVNGTVYSNRTAGCVPFRNSEFPCNIVPQNCSFPSAPHPYRLPILQTGDNNPICTYYYTCSGNGVFMGVQACPPGQVYDMTRQRCMSPGQVPSPCGTAPLDANQPQVNSQFLRQFGVDTSRQFGGLNAQQVRPNYQQVWNPNPVPTQVRNPFNRPNPVLDSDNENQDNDGNDNDGNNRWRNLFGRRNLP